jgi:hypothetical protein
MYVFYINGGHVEKRFGREFINYICGGKIRHDIKADKCTRKRFIVTSRYAADKLVAANKHAVWPDGTTFKCRLLKFNPDRRNKNHNNNDDDDNNDDRVASRREFYRRRCRSDTPHQNKLLIARYTPSPALSEPDDKWYTSTSFIELDNDDDNNDTLENLHRDLRNLSTV